MDIILKSTIIVVILIAIVFGGYYAINQVGLSQPITQAQAVSLVTSDLQKTIPNSVINITNVTPSQFAGSWHILASIVTNATTPCPSYFIYSFDYPKYSFVYGVVNIYTKNCVIYGLGQNKSYTISSYPAAIARSYNLNIKNVTNFVKYYGYGSVVVLANYYNKTTLLGRTYNSIWLVNYSAPSSNHSVYVLLSQFNGTALLSYNKSR